MHWLKRYTEDQCLSLNHKILDQGLLLNTIYGIKNCDTVKKARTLLESLNTDYCFHDFRVDGISIQIIAAWLAKTSVSSLLNKRSTTWKQLPESLRSTLMDNPSQALIIETFIAYPTLIKRPVLVDNKGQVTVGFIKQHYLDL